MRNSRLVASVILATFLIFALVVNTFSATVPEELDVYKASLYYAPSTQGGSGVYDEIEPTFNSTNATFTIPEHNGDFSGNNLRSVGVLFYHTSSKLEFNRGYIYTFNFTFRMNNIDILPEQYILEFGVCNDDMSLTAPVADVVFNYTKKATYYEFYATAVVDVKSDLNFAYVAPPDELVYYLDIIGDWKPGSTVTLRNYTQTVTKSVGEEAYYQASLDAIKGLPQSEYDYIYNNMPDEMGEVEVIKGKFIQILAVFDQDIALLLGALTTDEARPCIYLPRVEIPILDIKVWEAQIFYFDDYLDSLNPNIMIALDPMLYFIRMVVFFGFATYTVYKIIRLEWWL